MNDCIEYLPRSGHGQEQWTTIEAASLLVEGAEEPAFDHQTSSSIIRMENRSAYNDEPSLIHSAPSRHLNVRHQEDVWLHELSSSNNRLMLEPDGFSSQLTPVIAASPRAALSFPARLPPADVDNPPSVAMLGASWGEKPRADPPTLGIHVHQTSDATARHRPGLSIDGLNACNEVHGAALASRAPSLAERGSVLTASPPGPASSPLSELSSGDFDDSGRPWLEERWPDNAKNADQIDLSTTTLTQSQRQRGWTFPAIFAHGISAPQPPPTSHHSALSCSTSPFVTCPHSLVTPMTEALIGPGRGWSPHSPLESPAFTSPHRQRAPTASARFVSANVEATLSEGAGRLLPATPVTAQPQFHSPQSTTWWIDGTSTPPDSGLYKGPSLSALFVPFLLSSLPSSCRRVVTFISSV